MTLKPVSLALEHAEQEGLIGPASRIGGLHDAIQRFAERVEQTTIARLMNDAGTPVGWMDKHGDICTQQEKEQGFSCTDGYTVPVYVKLPVHLDPVAIRHSFDGYGWLYIDNGHGSGWIGGIDKKDAEFLYTQDQVTVKIEAVIEKCAEEVERDICKGDNLTAYQMQYNATVKHTADTLRKLKL